MQYVSTRGSSVPLSASAAIIQGIAPDGGLYMPDTLPSFSQADILSLLDKSYPERAAFVIGRFLEDYSSEELLEYTSKAYASFEPGLTAYDPDTQILELYHGPTCAFKDFALQLLPYLLRGALDKQGETRTVVILTATSGDTGKAALSGFADVPGTKIAVFYPEGGTSPIQRLQMTTQEGDNVAVFAVRGNFDDAQTGVKQIFADTALKAELADQGYLFSSANSINWGRLVPQIAYYVSAYCDLLNAGMIRPGEKINVVVPTGNFGNILACTIARFCGLPVKRLICASNRNDVLTDFLTTGVYDANRPFFTTHSPSMDILISSNLERMLYAVSGQNTAMTSDLMSQLKTRGSYRISDELLSSIQDIFSAGCCDDPRTLQMIHEVWEERKLLIDPHTAVAVSVYEDDRRKTGDRTPALIVSTASPFKFPASVLKALGTDEPMSDFERLHRLETICGQQAPSALAGLEHREERFKTVIDREAMETAVRTWLHA